MEGFEWSYNMSHIIWPVLYDEPMLYGPYYMMSPYYMAQLKIYHFI